VKYEHTKRDGGVVTYNVFPRRSFAFRLLPSQWQTLSFVVADATLSSLLVSAIISVVTAR
jgi:hypothetical protein